MYSILYLVGTATKLRVLLIFALISASFICVVASEPTFGHADSGRKNNKLSAPQSKATWLSSLQSTGQYGPRYRDIFPLPWVLDSGVPDNAAVDLTFSPRPNNRVLTVKIQADGKILSRV
jgi:hypothetical protein